jgi:hypothetical protein
VDVAAGDALTVAPDIVEGSRLLAFVGIEPVRLRVYPRETHVAEKPHAFMLPRFRPNSRVTDLPDIALLGQTGPFDAGTLRGAIERTFAFRKTHSAPARLPEPPARMEGPYSRMAASDDLPWSTLADVVSAVRAFLDPLLVSVAATGWDPADWRWSEPR